MTTPTEFPPRQFASEAEIVRLGEGLLNCCLVRADWTHEAHFASVLYLAMRHRDILLERELPDLIRQLNVSFGGENTDTAGYHETLTQFYIGVVRDFVSRWHGKPELLSMCNALVSSPAAHRDYPLSYWSREQLFSPTARRSWISPDLKRLPFPISSGGG